MDCVGVLVRGTLPFCYSRIGGTLSRAKNNKEVKLVSKRANGKNKPKNSVTVNIFSNFKISIDGKAVPIFVMGMLIIATLVVSGIEPETLQNIRSLIEAWLGP